MSSIEQRLEAIDTKIAIACDTLEKVTQTLNSMTREVNHLTTEMTGLQARPQAYTLNGRRSDQLIGMVGVDEVIDSKDILLEGDRFTPESSQSERHLAPEMQIQRLTAQLTAAYGRIAALEEQLLARRRCPPP